jgi:16S rRNA processing protein RimM
VAELISTGAHEVLVVRDAQDGRERLLPFVETVVREVDRGGGRIRVSWQRDW